MNKLVKASIQLLIALGIIVSMFSFVFVKKASADDNCGLSLTLVSFQNRTAVVSYNTGSLDGKLDWDHGKSENVSGSGQASYTYPQGVYGEKTIRVIVQNPNGGECLCRVHVNLGPKPTPTYAPPTETPLPTNTSVPTLEPSPTATVELPPPWTPEPTNTALVPATPIASPTPSATQPSVEENKPPVCVPEYWPDEGIAPLQVYVDGSKSHDPDGYIKSWNWSFPEAGTSYDVMKTDVIFSIAGMYEAKLTIKDDDGKSVTCSGWITVYEAPTATATSTDEPTATNTPAPTVEPTFVPGLELANFMAPPTQECPEVETCPICENEAFIALDLLIALAVAALTFLAAAWRRYNNLTPNWVVIGGSFLTGMLILFAIVMMVIA